MNRNLIASLALVVVLMALPMASIAHHGWSWTTGGNIELVGIIQKASLGNPHGVVHVDAEGEVWTVEVGQPWRNERAGLKPGDLAKGVELRAIGQPSADVNEKRMKAERLFIGGRKYDLYPDRD